MHVMKHIVHNLKKILGIFFAISMLVVLMTEYNNFKNIFSNNQEKLNDSTDKNDNIESQSDDVQTLLNNLVIAEPADVPYDRDDWTSSSQYYECENSEHNWHNTNSSTSDDNGEYTSIRAYGYYESKFYDANTDSYTDPYNGSSIDSLKSTDWDHICPLAWVNMHGGYRWSDEQKKAFADDPMVGVCVTQHDNRAKGAKGPTEWLPEINADDYCYTWTCICERYSLTVTQQEKDVITQNILNSNDGLQLLVA